MLSAVSLQKAVNKNFLNFFLQIFNWSHLNNIGLSLQSTLFKQTVELMKLLQHNKNKYNVLNVLCEMLTCGLTVDLKGMYK